MKKIQFVLGAVFSLGFVGHAFASAVPASETPSFTVTMDKEGCPDLKVGDPFLVHILAKSGASVSTVMLGDDPWSLRISEKSPTPLFPGAVRPAQDSVKVLGARNGVCRYVFEGASIRGERLEIFLSNTKKGEEKAKAMETLRGDLLVLRQKYPSLKQSDFASALGLAFR